MNQRKTIHPSEASAEVIRERGILFDVRNGAGLSELSGRHYRMPLSDIEGFMKGTLGGERVRDFVSTLIFLSSKWRFVYIVADSESEAMAASLHLAKLGFMDAILVMGEAAGFSPVAIGPAVEKCGAPPALLLSHA